MNQQKRLELLTLLQQDARRTPDELAALTGESPEAIGTMIAALESERVILRYPALIDWEKAGADRVTAIIDVKMTPQRDVGFDRLATRIARFPEVSSCYLMSGAYDLAVVVEASSLKEVARFVAERLSTLDGVASTTTHFVLKVYKHDGVGYGESDDDQRLAVTP